MLTMKIHSQNKRTEFDLEKSLEKCFMRIMRNGKRNMTEGIELPNEEKIIMLGKKEIDKYLGILEANNTKQEDIKEKN